MTRATRARADARTRGSEERGAFPLPGLGPAAGPMTRMLHAPGRAGRGMTRRGQWPTRTCSSQSGPAGLTGALLSTSSKSGRTGRWTWIPAGAVRTRRSRPGVGRTRSSTPGPTRSTEPVEVSPCLGWRVGSCTSTVHASLARATSLSRLGDETPCKPRVTLHHTCTLVGEFPCCSRHMHIVFPSL